MIENTKFLIKEDIYSNISIEKIKNTFSFYETEILPIILKNPKVTQKMEGHHGLMSHTRNVVFRGICYAISIGEDPIPVVFACACHDLTRIRNDYDPEHGKTAAPITKEIMENFDLTEEQKNQVINAVMYHTVGTIAPDYISACTWDADRTRISWESEFNEKYYNTELGTKIGSGKREDFIKFQQECIG